MADNQVTETVETGAYTSPVNTWDKYKKPVIGLLAAIVVIAAGFIIYKKMFKEPAEERAAEAIFKAEQYFANDSLNAALNGDGTNRGFLQVISNHGGTEAANRAHFYAGVIYLRQGDYKKAVEHLKDFSTDARQIQMVAYGRLGDAYSELKQNDEAVDAYQKAANTLPEDDLNASEFLFRAGYLLESMGKTSEALEAYKKIKEKYPRTEKGFSVDKYIYRLSIEENEFSVK